MKSNSSVTNNGIDIAKLSQSLGGAVVQLWGYDKKGHPVYEVDMPLDILEVDDNYQREMTKLIQDFDPVYAGVLKVSYRNGKFYIVDGNHRRCSALAAGITTLHCIIYTGLSEADEATIFGQQADSTTPMSPKQKYKAALCAKDPIALAHQNLLDKYGLTIRGLNNKSKKIGAHHFLTALNTTWGIAKKPSGLDKLAFIFEVIDKSNWCIHTDAYIAKFINAYDIVWDDAVKHNCLDAYRTNLIHTLAEFNPTIIDAYAKVRHPFIEYRQVLKVVYHEIAEGIIDNDALMQVTTEMAENAAA